ncbi:unnamed protein product [Urochloa decumbens]|uniref:Uncharacterized protein n=1 Tax=Urochloa decumbens TaxID=240449 RepID=A0ABC9C6P0_9POAL
MLPCWQAAPVGLHVQLSICYPYHRDWPCGAHAYRSSVSEASEGRGAVDKTQNVARGAGILHHVDRRRPAGLGELSRFPPSVTGDRSNSSVGLTDEGPAAFGPFVIAHSFGPYLLKRHVLMPNLPHE